MEPAHQHDELTEEQTMNDANPRSPLVFEGRQSSKIVEILDVDGLDDTMRASFARASFAFAAGRSFKDSVLALKDSVSGTIARGTVVGTTLNTLCNVVGGGVLALPLAMRNSSLLPGLSLLVLSAAMSVFSAVALTEACDRQNVYSLQELMAISLPNIRYAGAIVQGVIFMNNFGILIVYARVIADSIPPVLSDFFGARGVWTSTLTWLIVPAIAFFILSCARNMEELKWTSLMGFATILYIVGLIVVAFEQHEYEPRYVAASARWLRLDPDMFKALPTLALAFGYHYNVPVFYGEMQDRTPKKMNYATLVALGIVFVLYMATGVCGYLMFGERVADHLVGGSIINNFARTDTAANIGRIGLLFHFACVYPMVSIGARNSLHTFMVFVTKTPPRPKLPVIALEAFAIVTVSVVIAGVVPGIAIVIEVIGSLFGVATISIIPGIIAYKLLQPRDAKAPKEPREASDLLGDSAASARFPNTSQLGAVVAVMGVIVSVAGFVVVAA